MAEQLMTVVDATKALPVNWVDHASTLAGDAAGGDDFTFPNDGKTVLLIDGTTGDTFTFTAVADKFGRVETLAPVVTAGKYAILGPFLPELWNDPAGLVHFVPTGGNAGDNLLAVRVANPS